MVITDPVRTTMNPAPADTYISRTLILNPKDGPAYPHHQTGNTVFWPCIQADYRIRSSPERSSVLMQQACIPHRHCRIFPLISCLSWSRCCHPHHREHENQTVWCPVYAGLFQPVQCLLHRHAPIPLTVQIHSLFSCGIKRKKKF